MLVAISLAPSLKLRREGDDDDEEEGDGIWPVPKKPHLLPSPWKSLPLDLLFRSVLVRLPFSVLLKLRSISRSWRQSLSSHDFWFLWFQGNPNRKHKPFLSVRLNPNLMQSPIRNPITEPHPSMQNVIFNHRNPDPNAIQHNPTSYSAGNLNPYQVLDSIISNYSPNPNNCPVPFLLLCSAQFKASPGCQAVHWLRQNSIRYVQPQNALPTHRIPHYWSRLHESFLQVQHSYIILACDGGLILLATCGNGSRQHIICNPLLRAHKVLPHSLFPVCTDISAMATGFIVDKERAEYRILLYGVACQVYNSSIGKWQMISAALLKNPASASPPMLDGSNFLLLSMNSDYESTLLVYHARGEVVTCVSTRFPWGVSFPKCGRVWKDAHGLQTLAWSSTWFGTWKLDSGLWKCEKVLPFSQQQFNLSELDYVKVDNLLLLRFLKFNQVYIFDFQLDKGCWTPCCSESDYLTGHCIFQPSCIQV